MSDLAVNLETLITTGSPVSLTIVSHTYFFCFKMLKILSHESKEKEAGIEFRAIGGKSNTQITGK